MLAVADADETDSGLSDARRELARLCLATRAVTPVTEMIRYVAGPDRRVVPDIARKLPGRGAWVTATREALETALRQKAFGRAFRGEGIVPEDLPDLVERLLARDALDALSLANKAGVVVTGAARIEALLADEPVAGLVHARDAAAGGADKIAAAARRRAAALTQAEPVRVSAFSGEQLDLALGRANVVHAALLPHPASTGFLARCLRLDRWRRGGPAG